jgi:hypothetical protein
VQRSAWIFAAGIAVGVLVSFAVVSISRREKPASVASSSAVTQPSPARSESSPQKSNSDEEKILLGDIATVPFQELYGIISSRSPEEVTRPAQQLMELPAGRETNARITAFFKAWAHLDAKTAFAAATSFKSVEAKGTAIGAVINGADAIMASFLASSIAQLPPEALSSTPENRLSQQHFEQMESNGPGCRGQILGLVTGGRQGLDGSPNQHSAELGRD